MKWIISIFSALLFVATYMSYSRLTTKNTLYVYMWSDYIRPDIIELFQKEHDCWVIVDTYDSNEAMYTKLLLGASGYDIVFPSNYFVDLMTRRGMLSELDLKTVPNSRFIDRNFLENTLHMPISRMGVPYMVTFAGIAWRNDRINPTPLSWNLFSSDALIRRMTLLNDMRETIGSALRTCGYSANSLDPKEITQAKELIIRSWRPKIAKFESEQYKNGIASGEYLAVHGFSGDCLQVISSNPAVSFSYPKEGALAAVDYGCIMASSKNPTLAADFLNFLMAPEVAAENVQFTCARAPNSAVRAKLPEPLRNSSILYPEDDPTLVFETILPVDAAQGEYTSAWDEIKSGKLD